MILPFLLLLPRLFTGAGEPAGAIKLSAPHVDYKINEASATTSPWIDANGWRIRRAVGKPFFVKAEGEAAALAAAEAYVYGADLEIATDANGKAAFNRMLDFLRTIPPIEAKPVANIGVVDDGSDAAGELMNLLARRNLLYAITPKPDPSLPVTAPKAEEDPDAQARKLRSELGDDNRSLRVFGSEVVIAYLTANATQTRVHILNYGARPIQGLRVRVKGIYRTGTPRIYGQPTAKLEDWTTEEGGTEFTVANLPRYAAIDLTN